MDKTLFSTSAKLIMAAMLAALSAVSTAAVVEPEPKFEDHLTIGPGITYNSAPFYGLNSYNTPLPIFSFRYGHFFGYNNHDEPVIGFDLFQHKRISLSVAVTSGRTFLDISEINPGQDTDLLYAELQDRDRAGEVGLIFRYFSRVGLFEAKAFHDVESTYDGTRSVLSMARPFPETGKWEITPRLFIKHYSEKFNKYYYGVTALETSQAIDYAAAKYNIDPATNAYINQVRATYAPGNSAHYGVDMQVHYHFNPSFQLSGYIGIEKFSGEVETSDLTEDKELILGNIGIQYKF